MIQESRLDEQLARTVLRQGELTLRGQLDAALAADQRALILVGTFTTIALATLGAGFGLLSGRHESVGLGFGAIITGLVLVAATVRCWESARPTDFYFPGSIPYLWWEGGAENRPLAESLRKETENYDKYIQRNNDVMNQNAAKLDAGARLAVLSPAIGFLTAVVVQVAVNHWA